MSRSIYAPGHHPASRKKPGQLCTKHARNNTGCIGVSLKTRFLHGNVRRFYQVCLGKKRREFSVDFLGVRTAFRAAVEARAAYELSLTLTTHPAS